MDKIFEALINLIPFSQLFEKLGISKATSVAFAGLINTALVYALYSLLRYLVNHYKNSKAANDLAPYFNYQNVKSSRELFIPTQFQNQSPTHEEEPAFSHQFVSKKLLIPFFMKTAFNEKKESDKFYLVLADSGMGKTTFMINLYAQYTSFFNFGRKYKIRFYPFGDARILEQIKRIKPEEVSNTILLLDAFDEDKKLNLSTEPDGLSDDERFRRRLDEIIETVRDFREVIITSRTQYFSGQENQPYELKIPRFDEKGFHKLAKFYLSPFDSKEITRYLNKKYGVLKFWNRKKKQTATTIINNSPKLMVRPMLLSYIDFLVESKQGFKNTYQIYETLVDKWIEREANKRKHQTSDREKFKQDLHKYSQLVAVEIYRQRTQTDMLYLEKDAAIKVARQNNIDLRGYEITGQSLLTRDAEGNWKFAHKSILEFLLAKEAFKYIDFWTELAKSDFAGMDMARLFYEEVGNWVFVEGGTFRMGDENGELSNACRPAHQVTVPDFCMGKTPVTQKQWGEIMGTNPSCFEDCGDCPVETVSWNDVQAYIDKLNAKTGIKFCLPTEAEWEYAAHGGHKSSYKESKGQVHIGKYQYAGSDNLDEVGWYYENSKNKTHPVGTKKPNELGLCDMSGNVWEWCQDKWHDNYRGAPSDGTTWESGDSSYRVLRGGSWDNNGQRCRSANRDFNIRDDRNNFIGFRLVFFP
jgi:formylglycine-generating enzyme required for sulfatase activity